MQGDIIAQGQADMDTEIWRWPSELEQGAIGADLAARRPWDRKTARGSLNRLRMCPLLSQHRRAATCRRDRYGWTRTAAARRTVHAETLPGSLPLRPSDGQWVTFVSTTWVKSGDELPKPSLHFRSFVR